MLIVQDLVASNQWNMLLWSQNWFIEIKFQFGNYVLWFLRVASKHALKFQRQWFKPHKIQYYLPNDIVKFIIIDKFDPNLILVNIKFKPYRFIEDKTLQPILAKLGDLITNELVQIQEPKALLVEPANFQPIEFESINNHLTHGNIKGTDVPIYYYHDVPIEDVKGVRRVHDFG